jgi:hypothetical protein
VRRTDHLSRGVIPSVACLSVIYKAPKGGGLGPIGAVAPQERKEKVVSVSYASCDTSDILPTIYERN